MDKIKSNIRKAKDALGLFQFGYKDNVIALWLELNIDYVADLRKAWEECEKQ